MIRGASRIPGRMQEKGNLVADEQTGRVCKVVGRDNILPGTVLILETVDQMADPDTSDYIDIQVGWEERLNTFQALSMDVTGQWGKEGKLTVELAEVAPGLKPKYRYRIHDRGGEQIETKTDLELAEGEAPNNRKAMTALVDFLGAAADAYRAGLSTGRRSENLDLFERRTVEWAYNASTELETLALELEDGGRSPGDG